MPECIKALEHFAKPQLITILVFNQEGFSTTKRNRSDKSDQITKISEEICDTKVWSIENYGNYRSTLVKMIVDFFTQTLG